MTNICAKFYPVKAVPIAIYAIRIQLLSMQFQFLMKETIILYLQYFSWHYNPTNTYSPLPQVLSTWLKKKLEIWIYPQNFCYAGYNISANYSFFSTSNLIEIKIINFCSPQLNKHNQARVKITYRWRLPNQKSNTIAYLIRTNYLNMKYIQRISFIKNVPLNFRDDKI